MEPSRPRSARSAEIRRNPNFIERFWKLLSETYLHWNAVKAQRLGAALAYYTVFALAPLLIIAILISGAIFGQAAAQERIVGQIGYLMGPQGAAGVAGLIAQQPFPGSSGALATWVSVGTLILGAIGLFGQLQEAFDTVWEITPAPARGVNGLLRKRIASFGMVVAVGFLMLVALLVNTALAAISGYLGPQIPNFGLITTVFNVVVPLGVTTLLFAALFKYMPDVHLAWRDLWGGAALTAVLFTVGKIAIGVYLGHSSLASASGAAGSLLVVLVWVYYSAQILLFGAVYTHITYRYRHQQALPSETLARPDPTGAAGVPAQRALLAPTRAALPTAAPRRSGWLGALLGFVVGVGAGAMVAVNNRRGSDLTR